ncbi:MAG: T9SS type A sorting domain-containing protein, partial [Bacteroidales bacterium]|nr:T9SS type A sorting domain-containing protein [Bacteroidales bacterium]
NDALSSLTGLDNIDASSIDLLYIYDNFSLSTCEVHSVCDYLINPTGTVEIHDNSPGCNSQEEVEEACEELSSCLPEGITFTTQAQIDSFQTNYPNCTEIEGDVQIGEWGGSADIHNLDGLIVLNSILGSLNIYANDSLPNLSGLNNLTYIDDSLHINSNNALTSLTGLENLNYINGSLLLFNNDVLSSLSALSNLDSIGYNIIINNNDELTNLTGLENLTYINGSIKIGYGWGNGNGNKSLINLSGLDNITHIVEDVIIGSNNSLISLTGLESLTSIGGDLSIGYYYINYHNGNHSLINLSGLNNLSSIGGNLTILENDSLSSITELGNLASIGGSLDISSNYWFLTSLTGLENINPESIDNLYVRYNFSLSECEVQSICDYLAAPNGTIVIYGNAPGCNSQAQVQVACDGVSIWEIKDENDFIISPNPLESTTLIQYTLSQNSSVTVQILDISGQEFETLVNETLQKGKHKVVFDATKIKAGIYFCVLKTSDGIQTKKIIKLD